MAPGGTTGCTIRSHTAAFPRFMRKPFICLMSAPHSTTLSMQTATSAAPRW